jgi:outer membrane protein OmpA-like peptidoglycan-associated protein
MRNLLTILLFAFFCGISTAQNSSTTSITKAMTMTFEGYSEGDYPHFIFKDVKTGQEYDFRFISDNNLGNLNILLDDPDSGFGYKANSKYLKKKFTIIALKKSVLDSDLEGNTFTTKAWVISKISLITPSQTNVATIKLPFIGKRWYTMENSLAYGTGYMVSNYIEIKTDSSVYFGNVVITKGDERYEHKTYAGKFKNIIYCNDKQNIDIFPACNGFYKITLDMIYTVDAKGNILKNYMCCKGDFPEETKKCNCQSKLITNQYEYDDIVALDSSVAYLDTDSKLDEVNKNQDTDKIKFDLFKSTITPSSMKNIDKIINNLNKYTWTKLYIDGYADKTEYDESEGAAKSIGVQRAIAVRDYLISIGIDGSKLSPRSFGYIEFTKMGKILVQIESLRLLYLNSSCLLI